ncbi:MAG: cysteine synthase A [Clostridia bacterium]|nr:cysteine synthase A [Clostridia bacterium]
MNENEFASLPGRGKIYGSVAELCGSTPLLRVRPELPAVLLYKLEAFNPAGSAKDRVALNMLRCAANTGKLRPGGTVIEPTSGNTGIGLAAYGVPMGYRVVIVMPDSMSRERIDLIKAYGAEIVLTPGARGMQGAIEKAEEIRSSTPGSVIASQFDNPANPAAHYASTGPEIWKDTEGKVDIIVAGIGTGGTLCGTAMYLKEKKPSVKAIGCEPASSPLIRKGYSGPHKIQGIGANFVPANFNPDVVDGIADITNEDAIAETVKIARETGLLVGISSGCAAFEAARLASLPENAGKTIVAILPDTGEHYISTGIFEKR